VLRVPVRDLTGGFKCFRRRVLETLDLDAVHADGYGFQIEMTYRALKAGFHVREVPIVFRDREVGSSKMNYRIAVEAVWKVPALKATLR
jgi:dolichol-phosphate mannosyltransferase